MLSFAVAVFLLIVTPGPGVLSVAGVGSGFGARAGARYIVGLFLGNNLVGAAVISGLAALVLAIPYMRGVLLVASLAYLVWLAARIALAGSRIAFHAAEIAPGIRDGIALQMVNPKAYAVNTALYSGFAFMPANPTAEVAIKILILNAIWIVLHFLWLGIGIGIRRMALPGRIQRLVNLGMAATMLGVVALALVAGAGG
ncbi:MAG: LysE family translocator [Alphaproteobacteria bacterium]|nr:MAG: LysE family translocator [Alphaproteobacteria bacterium]